MIKLKFADVVISVRASTPELVLDMPPVYRQFSTQDQPDIQIKASLVDEIAVKPAKPVFLSQGNWDLLQSDDQWVIHFYSPPGTPPYQAAVFDHDFKHGEILVDKNRQVGKPFYPLSFPLDEILMINLLAQGRGVELHSCGISLDDIQKGLLFAGMSGAGKSTLTRLWQQRVGTTILSDDRVILRKKDNDYWIFGTPWHGDALGSSACSVPVDQIFILKQAPFNSLTELKPAEAAAKLLARCFPTYWDADGMAYTLEFLGELSLSVPCYEFAFVPDQTAIDFIYQNIAC